MFNGTKKAAETYDVKHPKPFAYRIGDNARPSLQPRAYRARELLNCTVASFYEISNSKLTPHQRQAKKDFIELFESQAKIPLQDLSNTCLDLYATLMILMRYLDKFFFFGSLTHGSPPPIQKLVLTGFPPGTDHLASCQVVNQKGFPEFVISLNKDAEEHQDLPQLVATLIHEMTHAFLMAFVCGCPRCRRNEINTVGMEKSGHGPTFRGLHYAVMVCMADWSAELDGIFRGCSNGTYIDTPSLNLEIECIEGAKESGILKEMGMLPYIKNPSHRLLIWTSEKSIFVDVERLRANVRRTGASVGTSVRRQTNRGTSSTGAGSLGGEAATGFPKGWSDTDSEGADRLTRLEDADAEMNSPPEESRCICCPASTCGLPIMKGKHRD
ncbi:hypothetical protein F4801DRAFT_600916 [Xylaria longipes]|nr:hypothetical protein F4801DRAFT_600916 [Xylaria longipes]